MSLTGLPTELLDSIIALTLYHPGFEGIVLTCKATYEVGKFYLPEYNALRRHWRSVSVTGTSSGDPVSCLDILATIAQKPVVATFIQELDLAAEDATTESGELSAEIIYVIKEVVTNSRALQIAGQDAETWINGMRMKSLDQESGSDVADVQDEDEFDVQRASRMYGIVLLLTLLPNLKTLTLPVFWGMLDYYSGTGAWGELMDTVVEHHDKIFPPPLRKLETLRHVEEIEYDPSIRSGLGIVSSFVVLPALTALEVNSLIAVDDGYTGVPFTWPDGDATSNLQRIDLPGCCIDAAGITELLRHTPFVKSLSYSHCTKWHGCQHDWDAGAFVQAVGKQIGDTLTDLSITIFSHFGEIETGVASMEDFKVLEHFEADVSIFCAPPTGSGIKLGLAGRSEEPWPRDSVPSLTSILPPSIKVFEIVGTPESEQNVALRKLCTLDDLTHIPNLEQVCAQFGGADKLEWQVDGDDVTEQLAAFRSFIMEMTELEEGEDA